MSSVDVLLQLEAAQSGEARQRTTLRHRHIEKQPMVVVTYKLAGESAAPLGIMYGRRPNAPVLRIAPEPRNRDIRFREVVNPFAEDLCTYVRTCAQKVVTEGGYENAAAAPQIIVPNGATHEFVGSLLGRSLRYLRTDGDFAVPETTVEAGAHLTWLATRAEHPGSCVLVSGTELLRRHWITGLSDLETEDLHVALAWIAPPDGMSGEAAAAIADERRTTGDIPAAGPTPDPSWDRDTLDPLIEAFNDRRNQKSDEKTVKRLGTDIAEVVGAALRPAWEATWQAIALLRDLPEAPSVETRWAEDRRDFTNHSMRVTLGNARFRTRDSVKQAAWMVNQRENAQAQLEADEALDDPLVMAGAVADGHAVTGIVTHIERPHITLELSGPCVVPVGTELNWTDLPDNCSVVVTEFTHAKPFTVTLETNRGKTKYYPEIDARATYSPYNHNSIHPPKLPVDVPWTHVVPASEAPQPEVPD